MYTAAFIDELYLFLTNMTAIEYIRNAMKRVRKKGSAVIIASQNIEDFNRADVREMTKPMFAIPTHQFLFNPGNISKKEYMEMLRLDEFLFDLISSPLSPMAVAVMTKKALGLAEDKRVRTLLASIVAGIVIVMLIPLLVMVSIFNTQAGFSQEVARIVFDGGPIPTDIDAELSKAMEEMMDAFEELDQTIDSLEEEGFDDIKVKSFFYILYFTKDITDFDEEFYEGFVDCFRNWKEAHTSEKKIGFVTMVEKAAISIL